MIPLTRPLVAYEDVAEQIRAILRSGTLTGGEAVRRFESEVAAYVGTRHAVATTSATAALHLVLAAWQIGPGDEVLVSDFTHPASGNAIAQCGAVPIMIDCRPEGFDLDLDQAAAKIGVHTRALMVVDPFGQPANMRAASELATTHDLLLLEDAACALGATRDGRRCGAWPGAGCFSFHPRKIITTGEGGMITTDDDHLADRARVLRNHGGVAAERVGQRFEHHGFNYRMSEIHAALGSAQLLRLDEFVEGRRAAANEYLRRLRDLPGLTVPGADTVGATFQSFVVLLDDEYDRDAIVLRLRARDIETTLGTYALHAHPAFARYGTRPGDLPRSYRAQRQSLTLPLWPGMDLALIETVVTELAAAMSA